MNEKLIFILIFILPAAANLARSLALRPAFTPDDHGSLHPSEATTKYWLDVMRNALGFLDCKLIS